MPVVVALFIRALIQFGATTFLISMVEKFLIPLLDSTLVAVMKVFGVDEETAKDIVANEILKTAEFIGLGALALKSKIPTKVAEKLGFTSKGYKTRTLKSDVAKKTAGAAVATSATTAAEIEKAVEVVAKTRGVSFQRANEIASFLIKIVGAPIAATLAIANIIDFGAWPSSAYQSTFQKLLSTATLGLISPDKEVPNARVINPDIFDKIYNALKQAGAIGINDPYKNMNLPFTRQNLIDLVDKVAALIDTSGGKATYKTVLGTVIGYIVRSPEAEAAAPIVTVAAKPVLPRVSPIKVFTGVLVNGTLGEKSEFVSRPDDLIESGEELQEAAHINLAEFYKSLPGRIVYEIKIVNQVVAKDGFTQRGTTRQVVSGYNKDGSPRYKNITNKFAVLNVYIMAERGTRTKLASVVLGPTDAVKFQPNANQVKIIEDSIKANISTADIKDVQGIKTAEAITITTPEVVAPVRIPEQPKVSADFKVPEYTGTPYKFYKELLNNTWEYMAAPWAGNIPFGWTEITEEEYRRATGDIKEYGQSDLVIIEGVPYAIKTLQEKAITEQLFKEGKLRNIGTADLPLYIPTEAALPSPTEQTAKMAAKTLSEWYSAQGRGVPPISERAALYESLGLGSQAYYTGTAEQNIKLLEELKKRG